MKVILTENIMPLGQIGQVVNVAPGYARNYLLPQGLALEATENVGELSTGSGPGPKRESRSTRRCFPR